MRFFKMQFFAILKNFGIFSFRYIFNTAVNSNGKHMLQKILLLSAKSSYIIIMIGPSSDFGSQPYFGYL